MNEVENSEAARAIEHLVPPMHERTIELADGRYMIFFTFDEDAAATTDGASKGSDNPNKNV